MQKKWKVIAPLALSAAGALAAAAAVLLKKDEGKSAGAKAAPAAKAAPKNLRAGSYSFISGYKNAATVELTLDYDADRFSFAVVEEDFLSYSSDSHVAILSGEDFNMQLEYAAYYGGEDFAAHSRAVAERYQSFGSVRFGDTEGIRYLDGDALCLNLPIPGDSDSYVLVSIFKGPEFDGEPVELAGHPDVEAILGSLRFKATR